MAWVQDIFDKLFDPHTYCVACISHGKDSIAMLRAIQLLGLPLHGIVTSDVWATQDIPADLPEMWEWKKQADQRMLDLYGVPVTHICRKSVHRMAMQRERERERMTPGCVFGGSPFKTSFTDNCGTASLSEKSKVFPLLLGDGAKISNMRELTFQKLFYTKSKKTGKIWGFPFSQVTGWCRNLKRFLFAPRTRGRK